MAFELTYAIIHSFTKEANTTDITAVVKKNVLLNTNLPAVSSLVVGVSQLLGKPGNSLSYGQFANDMRQGRFPSGFNSYITTLASAELFLDLSHIAVDELATEAVKELLSTGGHILVTQYNNDGNPYLLVAMIKQRGGVTLDDDYVPTDVTEIDLTKVHQAARINLTTYTEIMTLPAVDDDIDDDNSVDRTYLSFVGHAKNNEAAGYFVKALGCIKGVASSRATDKAFSAMNDFFSNDPLKKYKISVRNAVTDYLKRKHAANEPALLEELCNAAVACVIAEEQENTTGLKDFLNNEKNKVPSQFVVHGPTLKKKTIIKGGTDQWQVQFELKLLDSSENSTIYYNKEDKTLTFRGLNDNFIKSIETEINSRQSS
jgi:nucleoid-associated protein